MLAHVRMGRRGMGARGARAHAHMSKVGNYLPRHRGVGWQFGRHGCRVIVANFASDEGVRAYLWVGPFLLFLFCPKEVVNGKSAEYLQRMSVS